MVKSVEIGKIYLWDVTPAATAAVLVTKVVYDPKRQLDRVEGWWSWVNYRQTSSARWQHHEFAARRTDITSRGKLHPDQEGVRIEVLKAIAAHAAGVSQ